jgi:hypothetical protein
MGDDIRAVYGDLGITADERVTPLTGYCPHCPIHEGIRPFVRLVELTREMRQCPKCRRIYVVSDPNGDV